MIDELTLVLRPFLGDEVVVDNLRPLTGGASRITYAFDAVAGTSRRSLILRTAPTAEGQFASMELEAAVQSAAAQAGAPVPNIITASNSPAALGNPYLICDEIVGETIVRKIARQLDDAGRSRLLNQCGQALAAIHRAATDASELVERDELVEWRQRLDDLDDTTATFEWAFRWLEANQPEPGPRTLTHGDFRMGNLIVEGSTLAAVLDWEAVHIGDLHEDLAWFGVRAWRFGAPPGMAAGGLGSVEEFVSAYE
ncbi:MAG: phosphotransferase family protein, partial [Mycobacterium sp.]